MTVEQHWPVLSVAERRILGVLVEKQKTTDTYPLSLNAVVVGSNQKSNRDPILNWSEDDAEAALVSAQKKGLVMRIISGRVDKWKHLLYDAWKVSSADLAILAELLLRGPQTEGELRSRASRMDDIADLDQLRTLLKGLVERGFVIYLTPQDRRGAVLTHGFHDSYELEHLQKSIDSMPGVAGLNCADSGPPPSSATPELDSALAELRQQLQEQQRQIDRLRAHLERLHSELGLVLAPDGNSDSTSA